MTRSDDSDYGQVTKIQLWQNDRNVRFLELKALADTIMNQAAAPPQKPRNF